MLIDLRNAEDKDEAFLFRLFCSIREPDFCFFGEVEKRVLLEMQFAAQQRHFRVNIPEARDMIVMLDGQPVGRICTAHRQQELHLVEIALLPEYRNRGIGSHLMKGLERECEGKEMLPIRLQAHCGSPAIRFYQRHGFIIINDNDVYVAMENKLNDYDKI